MTGCQIGALHNCVMVSARIKCQICGADNPPNILNCVLSNPFWKTYTVFQIQSRHSFCFPHSTFCARNRQFCTPIPLEKLNGLMHGGSVSQGHATGRELPDQLISLNIPPSCCRLLRNKGGRGIFNHGFLTISKTRSQIAKKQRVLSRISVDVHLRERTRRHQLYGIIWLLWKSSLSRVNAKLSVGLFCVEYWTSTGT